MNYRYRIVVALLTLTVLAGCGSKTTMQPLSSGPFTVQIADSYSVVSTAEGADATYQAGSGDEWSVIQMAQSRVDSGVTIDQMASLNLQKLELSLPWYEFVEQSSRSVDCDGDHDGQMVSFITQQGDNKLFHSQYYTLIDGQWYVWSASSTTDTTRKTLTNMVKSAVCG